MPKHPIYGMKGTKTHLGSTTAQADARERFETNNKLDRIYKQRRNLNLRLKNNKEALALGLARDQLIEKELVIKQLTWFLTAIRSRLLALPGNLTARFGSRFSREMREQTDEMVRKLLEELSRLPESVEADWQEQLEEEK